MLAVQLFGKNREITKDSTLVFIFRKLTFINFIYLDYFWYIKPKSIKL